MSRPLLGLPMVAVGPDGRVLILALELSVSGGLWLRELSGPGDDWIAAPPSPARLESRDPPVALPRLGGGWDLFCRGRDAACWAIRRDTNGWGEWKPFSGAIERLAGFAAASGEQRLFASRNDGTLGWLSPDDPGSRWQDLGGAVTRIAVGWDANRVVLAAVGQDGVVRSRSAADDLSAWMPWTSLGGSVPETGRIAAAVREDGTATVYVLGHDRAVWTCEEAAPGKAWTPWMSLGGNASEFAITYGPGASEAIYARTAEGALCIRTRDAAQASWSPWRSLDASVGSLAVARQPMGGAVIVSAEPHGPLAVYCVDPSNGERGAWTNLTPWIEIGERRRELASRFAGEWTDPALRGTSCGPGSTLEATRAIRAVLPAILRGFEIRVLNDAGCGDRSWIRELDLSGVDYLGYDLRAWPSAAELPFELRDIVHEPLRPCDLVLCRDVLFHLPNHLVLRALRNFAASSRYLLTTSMDRYWHRDAWHPLDNLGRHTWSVPGECGYSPLNLEAAPFRFPPPLLAIPERAQQDRFVGLWDLHAIPEIAEERAK